MVNHYEVYVIFQNIEHQLQENELITFFIIVFIKSSLYWEISSIPSKLFTESFCDIAHPYKLLSQYSRYDDFLFLS